MTMHRDDSGNAMSHETYIASAQAYVPHETVEARADRLHSEAHAAAGTLMGFERNGTPVYADSWPLGPVRGVHDALRYIISYIGDDPDREDLLETPGRVVAAYAQIFSGYREQESPLKWFKSAAQEMVIERDIDFWSTCEHHMLPFWGVVDVAYIPHGFVLGVSKIARLVEWKARRLQIQENLAHEICQELTQAYSPDDEPRTYGAAVSIRARHACMMSRGVEQSHSWLETNALSGLFKTDPSTRSEFMQGIRRNGH